MNYPLSGSRAPSQNLRGETRESEAAALGGRLQAGSLPHLLHRHHIHLHVQLVPGAAQENAVDGADVAVIASPGHGDMTVRGYAIVRGIEIHPSGGGAPRRAPGVRGVGAYQTRAPRRRHGSQIAADVTRRKAERPHAPDLEMSEVLAHAAALFEKRLDGGRDFGGLLVKAEILVDSAGEIENRREQRTSFAKRLARIAGQFRTGPHAWGIENELPGVQDLVATVAGQRPPHGLPGRRSGKVRWFDGTHFQVARGLHDEAVVRLVEREGRHGIAEVVEVGGGDLRRGQDGLAASAARLFGKIARSQTQHVMRYRDRVAIIVRGSVPDAIDQLARSISTWLK